MKILYRAEIDGIRAIAVISVIFYHLQIYVMDHQIFSGGYIGVDVFFVISGYLITSILINDLNSSHKFPFSLKYFYQRRIRRILPALIFVIIFSIPFAWFFLLPINLVDFSKSILSIFGFSSNFYFWYSGNQYGAEESLLKPLLHTWSLSIEEQYYLIFPFILLMIYKFLRKFLFQFLFLGLILSLGISDWGSKTHPSFNFYILPTRSWELLAGSLLAYFEVKQKFRKKSKNLNFILSNLGLILVLFSIFFFDGNTRHPSIYTTFPIVGVCLLIWFYDQKNFFTKFLSLKIFVFIGLISYSLYLWHFPVFAFARLSEYINQKQINIFFIIILTISLSIISYYFIERPARNNKISFKNLLYLIFLSIFTIILFATFTLYKDGKININNVYLANKIASPIYRSECKYSSNKKDFLSDIFFKNEFVTCKKKNFQFILVLGDSHSEDLFNSISKISKKNEFIIGLNKGSCRPSKIKQINCHYDNALKFIDDNKKHIKMIIFTHKGSYFFKDLRKMPIDKVQLDNTLNYLLKIKQITNNLVFVGPRLEPNIEMRRADILNLLSNKKIYDKTNYELITVDNELKEASKVNRINYISSIQTIQFDFKKDMVINQNLTYSDTDHWSDFGEIYFGRKLINNSILKQILF